VEVKIERGPLPAVEWWDKPLLKTGKYADVEQSTWNVKSEKVRSRDGVAVSKLPQGALDVI